MSMTMEQAIKILKSDLAIQKEFKALPDHIEALEMLIKTVEQKSCNDCISRQKVIDAFWKLNVELKPSTIDAILNMINDMPTVQPEPFINKPCVSEQACREDKMKILEKIKAEIDEYKSRQLPLGVGIADLEEGKQIALEYVLAILDKYMAESEDKE